MLHGDGDEVDDFYAEDGDFARAVEAYTESDDDKCLNDEQ